MGAFLSDEESEHSGSAPVYTHGVPTRRQPASLAPVKKTEVVSNPLNFKSSALRISRGSEVNLIHVEGVVDSTLPCVLTVYVLACPLARHDDAQPHVQIEAIDGQVFDRQEFGPDIDVAWRSPPLNLLEHSSEALMSEDPIGRVPLLFELLRTQVGDDVKEHAAQYTYARLCSNANGPGWDISVMRQIVELGESTYTLEEIFGLDKSAKPDAICQTECVICMAELRDTIVLPCRHNCLCSGCANIMRLQSNRCPICSQPVSSLLQICLPEEAGCTEVEVGDA
jgi:hypothetical protein